MRPNAEDITVFKSTLRGTLLQPGESEYDAARVVWNGMIDRRPGLIVQCHGVADVVAACRCGYLRHTVARRRALRLLRELALSREQDEFFRDRPAR